MTLVEAYQGFTAATSNATFFQRDCRGHRRCTDLAARHEAWCTYTDGLCKDGRITQKQYESWPLPWTRHSTTR